MEKQRRWIKKQFLISVVICSMGNKKSMIQKKGSGNMKMGRENLYFNVSKIKLADIVITVIFTLIFIIIFERRFVYFSFSSVCNLGRELVQ